MVHLDLRPEKQLPEISGPRLEISKGTGCSNINMQPQSGQRTNSTRRHLSIICKDVSENPTNVQDMTAYMAIVNGFKNTSIMGLL